MNFRYILKISLIVLFCAAFAGGVVLMSQKLMAEGAWVFGCGLNPAHTATVVRNDNGEVLLTDGPFIEGKEHLGGFTVITAPDLDAALKWARRLAAATTLPIEVRPLQR